MTPETLSSTLPASSRLAGVAETGRKICRIVVGSMSSGTSPDIKHDHYPNESRQLLFST